MITAKVVTEPQDAEIEVTASIVVRLSQLKEWADDCCLGSKLGETFSASIGNSDDSNNPYTALAALSEPTYA